MILYVVTLFCVHDPAAEQRLITSLRIGGEWHAMARAIAPQLIATDLLRHQHDAPAQFYLCLDFWTSAEAYRSAMRSTATQQLYTRIVNRRPTNIFCNTVRPGCPGVLRAVSCTVIHISLGSVKRGHKPWSSLNAPGLCPVSSDMLLLIKKYRFSSWLKAKT